MKMLDWDKLRIFHTAAESGSFTHAAEKLGMSQSAVSRQISALEDDQKKRATRSLRDGIDRVLTDLQSLFRDVVMLQYGRGDDLINRELRAELAGLAAARDVERTLVVLDHLAETREALERNVAPLLALESLLVTVTSGRKP